MRKTIALADSVIHLGAKMTFQRLTRTPTKFYNANKTSFEYTETYNSKNTEQQANTNEQTLMFTNTTENLVS
jgi:hypothetical protein